MLNEDALPHGYRTLELQRGCELLLPASLYEAAKLDYIRRQARAAEEVRVRDRMEADAVRRAEAPTPPPAPTRQERREESSQRGMDALETPAAAGTYRVFPGFEKLVDELNGKRFGAMDRDREMAKDALVEELVKKGPDRRLVTPTGWREQLAALEREMPNFAAPIAMLRRTLLVAERAAQQVRVPPMLLLGPPGLGKTTFAHRVAALMGTSCGSVAFDQPTIGNSLRGIDKGWANAEIGTLLTLVGLGDEANPVVVLDEMDKAERYGSNGTNPLNQLLGALEPQTARRIIDVAVDIEFDASMVTYIGTANTTLGLSAPLLSRFEMFDIQPCQPADAVPLAEAVLRRTLERLGLQNSLECERRAVLALAHLPPRAMTRAVESAVGTAVEAERDVLSEADVMIALEKTRSSAALLH